MTTDHQKKEYPMSEVSEQRQYENMPYVPDRSTAAMVLGVCSVVLPSVGLLGQIVVLTLAVLAWIFGQYALRNIDRGLLPRSSRGKAMAGYILGIIGASINLFGIVLFTVLIANDTIDSPYIYFFRYSYGW